MSTRNKIYIKRGVKYLVNRKGFTLIEMLLVLVILGTLAAIVIPKFAGRSEQARITATETQISNFETALDAFEVDNGFYPKGNEGLNELMDKTDEAKNWRGPYLKHGIPLDPWGNAYIYECPGSNNETGYDIMSMGPDGSKGTDDDITNWEKGK
jgi:general secretion pathway protein G